MRYLIPLTLLFLATGCGSAAYTEVTTRARQIEQPNPGQGLLHAQPIDRKDDYVMRLTVGGGFRTDSGGGSGQDSAELQTPLATAAGNLAFRLGPVEIGGLLDVAAVRADDTGSDRPKKYAMRFRAAPGKGSVRMGLSFDLGGREFVVTDGTSISCEVVADGTGGWTRVRGLDQCWATNNYAGRREVYHRPYFATTLYPSVEIVEGLVVFGGIAADFSPAVSHTRTRVLAHLENGQTDVEEDEYEIEYDPVVMAVAGLDLQLGDHLGLLVNVRSQPIFSDVDLPGPVFEGALSVRF